MQLVTILHPVRIARIRRPRCCSKGWVAQKPFFDRQFDGGAKIVQGLGPKRRESYNVDWVNNPTNTTSTTDNNHNTNSDSNSNHNSNLNSDNNSKHNSNDNSNNNSSRV